MHLHDRRQLVSLYMGTKPVNATGDVDHAPYIFPDSFWIKQ